MKKSMMSGRFGLPLLIGVSVLAVITVCWGATICITDNSSSAVISGTQAGYGLAGNFVVTNVASSNNAVNIEHQGVGGNCLYVRATGPFQDVNHPGPAVAWFQTTGAQNTQTVLDVRSADYNNANAAQFTGKVYVNGSFSSMNKYFRIDDVMDPANKYLVHSSVESPDQLCLYRGNVVTDSTGTAVVSLPGYFQSLNRDYAYTLTPVGQQSQPYVAQKVSNNSFVIKTAVPNAEVSWEVSGIRQDPYANSHRQTAEQVKPANEAGTYLDPIDYGRPITDGLDYKQIQAAQASVPHAQSAAGPGPAAAASPSVASRSRRLGRVVLPPR